eukprot:gene2089-7999_t
MIVLKEILGGEIKAIYSSARGCGIGVRSKVETLTGKKNVMLLLTAFSRESLEGFFWLDVKESAVVIVVIVLGVTIHTIGSIIVEVAVDMGGGCSRDISAVIRKQPSLPILVKTLEGKIHEDDIATENQFGIIAQQDPEVKPYVHVLQTFQLPPPPTAKQLCRSLLRKALMEAVSKAVPVLVEKSAEYLPFGSIAVALCKETSERVKLLNENREVAEELGRHSNKIVKHGQVILVYFDKTMDIDGKEEAKELLELTFCAFRLVADATRNGMKSNILRLINCSDLADGLEDVKRQLMVAVGLTNLIFNASMARKALQQDSNLHMTETHDTKHGSKGNSKSMDVPYVISSCRAIDAVDFWSSSGFGSKEKVDLQVLLEALEWWVEEKGLVLSSGKYLADNDALYFAFAGKRNLETVTAYRFAKVLGASNSIMAAIEVFCQSQAEYIGSQAELDIPNVSITLLNSAAAIPAKNVNNLLRETLQPVTFGEDLVQHQQAFVEGTREWVFADFEAWSSLSPEENQHRVFWIRGTGGLGKSVIAAQLVNRYGIYQDDENQSQTDIGYDHTKGCSQANSESVSRPKISAYFFCKHDHANRNDPRKVIATLAFRLASQHQNFRNVLHASLCDPLQRKTIHAHAISEAGNVEDAFSELLAKPLVKALKFSSSNKDTKHFPQGDVFILIDAPDELHAGRSRQQLLRLVGKLIPMLPVNVRLIVTSRPENDIVAFFKDLKPFIIDKQGELQQKDMEIYVRQEIIQKTGLFSLDDENRKEAAVRMIMDRADGVFLALKLIEKAIKEREDEHDSNGAMSLDELDDILGKSESFIDSTYNETLDRIDARLSEAADGENTIYNMLTTSFRTILAALTTAIQPLHLGDVHRLSSSDANMEPSAIKSKSLTRRLMNALSLLYSASSRNSGIEPLHKTVTDYLTDQQRSGKYFVDVRLGHAIHARTCLAVMVDYNFVNTKKIELRSEFEKDHLLLYAIMFGHIHLSECISSLSASRTSVYDKCMTSARCALAEWAKVFIVERSTDEKIRIVAPKLCNPCGFQVSKAFGAWFLLQIQSTERRRKIIQEFRQLFLAFRQICHLLYYENAPHEKALAILMRDMSFLYGAHWVSAISNREGILAIMPHIIVSSPLQSSAAVSWMLRAFQVTTFDVSLPLAISLQPCLHTFVKHTNSVNAVASGCEGTRIVTASEDTTVLLWDTLSGEVISTMEGHRSSVTSVAFSRDGRLIVSGSQDETVKVWDTMTGDLVITLGNHSNCVTSVDFSPDAGWVVSGSDDSTLNISDTITGEIIKTFRGHCSSVTAVSFSENGRLIVSGSGDWTVKLWDAATGEVIHTLSGHKSWIFSVACSADCERIASGSGDKTLKIWDSVTGDIISTLEGHSGSVTAVDFSRDGIHLASGSDDKTVKIWNVMTNKVVHTFEGHKRDVTSIAYCGDGTWVASSSDDKLVKIWDVVTDRDSIKLGGHNGPVFSVAISEDGLWIVSASHDRTVKIWDTTTGEVVSTLKEHNSYVCAVAISKDKSWIASGSDDKTVKIWDTMTGTIVSTIEEHIDRISSVIFSQNGKYIVSGSWDSTVKIWDTKTSTVTLTLVGHSDSISSLAVSRDGMQVASGSWDSTINIWNAITGDLINSLEGHINWVSAVAFDEDASKLVSGSKDKTVKVWNVVTGKLVMTLCGHCDGVTSVAVSREATWIVSGSRDKTLKIWYALKGLVIKTLEGHSDIVTSIALSRDEKRIISGSKDKTIKIWTAMIN